MKYFFISDFSECTSDITASFTSWIKSVFLNVCKHLYLNRWRMDWLKAPYNIKKTAVLLRAIRKHHNERLIVNK